MKTSNSPAASVSVGRIVAICTVAYVDGAESGSKHAALRVMPDGALDSSFASGGIVLIPGTEAVGWNWAHDLALDASGGILVLGGADNPQGWGGMLTRLKGYPLMDLVADMEPADRAKVIDRKFAEFAESQQPKAKQGMLQLPPRQ